METYSDIAIYVAGGFVLLVAIARLLRRGSRKKETTISPVSEQWLAERRGRRNE